MPASKELSSIDVILSEALQKRRDQNAFRSLVVNSKLIDFCSNDYLGFARSEELKTRIDSEILKTDFLISNHKSSICNYNGSTGSRLLSGNSAFAQDLEVFISKYHNASSGLLYNSGYDANIGLFSSVPKRGDTVIYDELIHASIHDGMRISTAFAHSFRHNDLEHLEERLRNSKGERFVAIESVYSMDGDFAPLKEIAGLCMKYNAHLIVDEAHATGVFGEGGKGRVVELGLEKQVWARIHTFGKALGCHGAIILGNEILRDFLINFSRSFIYTTALPLHSLISIKCAYDILLKNNFEELKNSISIELFKVKIKDIGTFEIIESVSPIQCLILSGNDRLKTIAKNIQKSGYDVRPILSPTVPLGKERLRICLHTFNTETEILGLTEAIKNNF